MIPVICQHCTHAAFACDTASGGLVCCPECGAAISVPTREQGAVFINLVQNGMASSVVLGTEESVEPRTEQADAICGGVAGQSVESPREYAKQSPASHEEEVIVIPNDKASERSELISAGRSGMTSVVCGYCRTKTYARDTDSGGQIDCPKCGVAITVPMGQARATSSEVTRRPVESSGNSPRNPVQPHSEHPRRLSVRHAKYESKEPVPKWQFRWVVLSVFLAACAVLLFLKFVEDRRQLKFAITKANNDVEEKVRVAREYLRNQEWSRGIKVLEEAVAVEKANLLEDARDLLASARSAEADAIFDSAIADVPANDTARTTQLLRTYLAGGYGTRKEEVKGRLREIEAVQEEEARLAKQLQEEEIRLAKLRLDEATRLAKQRQEDNEQRLRAQAEQRAKREQEKYWEDMLSKLTDERQAPKLFMGPDDSVEPPKGHPDNYKPTPCEWTAFSRACGRFHLLRVSSEVASKSNLTKERQKVFDAAKAWLCGYWPIEYGYNRFSGIRVVTGLNAPGTENEGASRMLKAYKLTELVLVRSHLPGFAFSQYTDQEQEQVLCILRFFEDVAIFAGLPYEENANGAIIRLLGKKQAEEYGRRKKREVLISRSEEAQERIKAAADIFRHERDNLYPGESRLTIFIGAMKLVMQIHKLHIDGKLTEAAARDVFRAAFQDQIDRVMFRAVDALESIMLVGRDWIPRHDGEQDSITAGDAWDVFVEFSFWKKMKDARDSYKLTRP
jgi:hypothetical protein